MTRGPRTRSRIAYVLVVSAVTAVAIVVGCGLDVPGTGTSAPPAEGGAETSVNLPDSSTVGDAGGDDASVVVIGDGGRCEDVCGKGDAGGSCVDGGCVFECTTASPCSGGVVCPPGVPCSVTCKNDDTCSGRVDCTAASGCEVSCDGKRSCWSVACGGTDCKVRCKGDDSCSDGGVACAAVTSCAIDCTGGGSRTCNSPISCKSNACSVYCDRPKSCAAGVVAFAGDASILCDDQTCDGGIRCQGGHCELTCQGDACFGGACCDAGTCVVNGAVNSCP